MRKSVYVLFLIAFLFSCASTEKYDTKLNSLIGVNKDELISRMGPPSGVKILPDGNEVISYTVANNVYVPSEFYLYNQGALSNEGDMYAPFLSDYDFSPYGDTFGYDVEYFCQTAFVIKNGVVTSWKWRGNNCVSD